MYWADKLADEVISRNPEKEEYVCAAGISPSGSIHIGNFRDIATSLFVVKALERKGKKAKLLFSWDEFDRMRKVPVNVANVRSDMEKYIGCPYVDVPNPFDTPDGSYAAYFEREFEEAIKKFGIEMDYRHQARMYRDGKYTQHILTALRKRGQIFDILDSFRTQDAVEGERERYYPVSIYCPECGKDTTTITSLSEDCTLARYECKCGHSGEFDFTRDHNCKLAWKVDWPMRWMVEGVDFEPGGKDHASPGGSYDTSRRIAKEIFGFEAPLFQGYEFIGIKGTTGKMSGSSGLNLTPGFLLNVYQPEVILWLYSRSEPTKAFDFCFDDGILRQYFEFDRQYNAYRDGTADDYVKTVIENCLTTDREISTVSMALLVQLGSIVDFNVPMMEVIFEKIGTPYKYDDFRERLDLARYWLEQCAPESANRLLPHRAWDVYETLSDAEKNEIGMLHAYLRDSDYTMDELQTHLYDIPKAAFGDGEADKKALKEAQGAFFRNVYRLLIGKETGPRLYLFLYAIEKERFLGLLDFSYPMTQEEKDAAIKAESGGEAAEEAQEKAPEKAVYGEPDPFKPFEAEIDADTFFRADLRVCEILKCQEIRKSHSCYKLTLDDGSGEKRVIVSSIKNEYRCEDLIGKKIVVIANLSPRRISGVTSQGMLLAATNGACGCKVLFADPAVPNGTRLM